MENNLDNQNAQPIMSQGVNSPPPPNQPPPPQATFDNSFISDEDDSGSPLKKILLIGGAIVGFLIVLILVITVMMSLFKGKSNEKVELTWWGLWEDATIFQPLIDDFHRQHPNITVKYLKQDIKLGKYVDKLRARIDNGTGPDMYRFHNSWTTQLDGYLSPFPESVVSTTELESKYLPTHQIQDPSNSSKTKSVREDLKIKGAYVGIPLYVDTLSLFVNNALLKSANEQPPASWDDLQSTAIHLTVSEEGKIITSGAALGTFDNVEHASDIISVLMAQNGANFQQLSGPQRKNAEDALAFYTHFAKGDDKVWDDTLENSRLAFAQGKVAMIFGYSWDIPEIKALAPNLDFSVVPVPYTPPKTANTATSIASYWAEGVSTRSKHSKEAFEFLSFISQKANLQKLHTTQAQSRRFGTAYPRSDMIDLLAQDPYLGQVMQNAQNAVSTPFSSDTYDDGMNASVNAYLGNAVRSVLNDSTSVESAIDTLSQGVNLVFSKYARQP